MVPYWLGPPKDYCDSTNIDMANEVDRTQKAGFKVNEVIENSQVVEVTVGVVGINRTA